MQTRATMETITITISAQTLNAIGAGLSELPFKIAKPAIAEIEQQVNAFLAAKKDKEKTDEQDSGRTASS